MGSKDGGDLRCVLWFLTWTPGYTEGYFGNTGGEIGFGGGNERYRFRQVNLKKGFLLFLFKPGEVTRVVFIYPVS